MIDVLFITATVAGADDLNAELADPSVLAIGVGQRLPGKSYRRVVWLCEQPTHVLARQWIEEELRVRKEPKEE